MQADRHSVLVPPLWRRLWPWQIWPDPPPETIGQLAVRLSHSLHSQVFRAALPINDLAVLREVTAEFAGYNRALGANDVEVLN